MDLAAESRGAVQVISVAGSLDALTAPALGDLLSQHLGGGHPHLVLDLGRLEYTSSAGLRVLLNGAKEARSRGGDLRLASIQPVVRKVLDLSGFTSILKHYPDVDLAVASFV